MNLPIYIPIFRLRQEEKKVLTTFDFGEQIYPYVEIFKELERQPPKPKVGKTKKESKPFHEIHIPTLEKMHSDKVFVDLPVHLKQSRKMKKEVLEFLRGVVANRQRRTKYLLSLRQLSEKIIPVISTYSQLTGEPYSIKLQETDLRMVYPRLAFRTSESTFNNDIQQIVEIAQPDDFLFVDLEDYNPADPDQFEMVEFMFDVISGFESCHVVLVRSSIPNTIKNFQLKHGQRIDMVDNSLMDRFIGFSANCFADYAGIKKDPVEDGGSVSPGFIFYDAVDNDFFGFTGSKERKLADFVNIIVPDVLRSSSALKMKEHRFDYLSDDNKGWVMLQNISKGIENGQNQAKFKRISMEHYLHCIRTKIRDGYFE